MDYQEAIELLKGEIKCSCYRNRGYCGICTIYSEMDRDKIIHACKCAISAMQELQQYQQLGTLEEVQEAVEKQRAKKATNIRGDKMKFCTCPSCEKRITNVEGGNYCQNCGQKLDWSEEE